MLVKEYGKVRWEFIVDRLFEFMFRLVFIYLNDIKFNRRR